MARRKKSGTIRWTPPDPSAPRLVDRVFRIFFVAVVAIEILLGYLFASSLGTALASRSWTLTKARIEEPDSGEVHRLWPGGTLLNPYVEVHRYPYQILRYRYSVNGQSYEGSSAPRLLGNQTRVHLLELPIGSEFDLFYDPQAPNRSSVVRGFSFGEFSPADSLFAVMLLALFAFIARLLVGLAVSRK